jgi:hypothetical protein
VCDKVTPETTLTPPENSLEKVGGVAGLTGIIFGGIGVGLATIGI